ncbi:MAG: hypothetical protein RLY20_1662 [Verrucomicrobiota bacterium]
MAEYQLFKQNRMIAELSSFAAQLRERIAVFTVTEDEFNARALELFRLQFTHNAVYRPLCEVRGVKAESVAHWSRIPAVPAVAFKELELTSIPPGERTAVFHSSGTTAQKPSRHFHGAESLAVYEASLWAWFEPQVLRALVKRDFHLVFLTPPPSAAPNSSLVHMFETARLKSRASCAAFFSDVDSAGGWVLDIGAVERALREAIAEDVPVVVLGTAFNFVHLLDGFNAQDMRLKLPPGSVVMETGGYKGRSRELSKAELHQFIGEGLGLPASQIICEYGMSEMSSQAYDDAARIFHFPPWARVQIVSPETGREVGDGEIGLVRIFDLANVFSVLAVQTEDLAIRRGDGFELLGRAPAAEPRGCSLMATSLPGA